MDAVRKHYIDVVVDATSSMDGVLTLIKHLKELGQERISTAEKEGVLLTQKLGFVYVSGLWVHGGSLEPVRDTMPVGVASAPNPPVDLVKARPGWEQEVLKSKDVLDVAIVRPSMVYGRQSWIFGFLWDPIYNAKDGNEATIPVSEETLPCAIHVDDVADAMRLTIEKLSLFSGTGAHPVFNVSTSQERISDLVRAAARSLGFNGKVVFAGPGEHPFHKALSTTQNADSSRAKQLLGWEPKKIGMLTNIDTYVMAWKAAKEQKSKL